MIFIEYRLWANSNNSEIYFAGISDEVIGKILYSWSSKKDHFLSSTSDSECFVVNAALSVQVGKPLLERISAKLNFWTTRLFCHLLEVFTWLN